MAGGRHLFLNGVNGADGRYLFPSLSVRKLMRRLRGRVLPSAGVYRGTMPRVDPTDLASAGWGVVFAHDAAPAVREALAELLEHRRRQARRFYRELTRNGPDDSKLKFLAEHHSAPGPVDPARLPYYLLLVGEPESIPFAFEHRLAVRHAVGRLCFKTPEEYAAYARNVVAVETCGSPRPREVKLFAVENPDDNATRYSSRYLASPLAESLTRVAADWQVETVGGDAATKAGLSRLLGGDRTPALLFTSCHGVGFPSRHPLQRSYQGALLCRDWPGPKATRSNLRRRPSLSRSYFFAARDLDDAADLRGMIAVCFACYGGGVPRYDSFDRDWKGGPRRLAPRAFVSRLPQRLLSHPRGALAVVAHVDRAWGFSFYWTGAGQQPETFEAALTRLIDGHPVGSAMAYFRERYGEIAVELSEEMECSRFGEKTDPENVARLWLAYNDARNYVILGDPAVRLLP